MPFDSVPGHLHSTVWTLSRKPAELRRTCSSIEIDFSSAVRPLSSWAAGHYHRGLPQGDRWHGEWRSRGGLGKVWT
jgi:hypothetical protein